MPKVSNALVPRAAGTVSPYYNNSHREISHLADWGRGASRDIIAGGLQAATGNIPGAAWSATKAVGKGLWHGGKAAVHGIKNSISRRQQNKADVKARRENKHAFDQRTELNKENTQLATRPSYPIKRALPNTPSKKDSVAKRSGPYKLKPSDRTYQDRMDEIGNEDIDDGGGPEPIDPQIMGSGGGGRGAAGSSKGISFEPTHWYLPRPIAQRSFHQTFHGMTAHKTVSLSGNNHAKLLPWTLDYYFNTELGPGSLPNAYFVNDLVKMGMCYRIPHAKISLDLVATTRETIIIQASTQYKTREIMDVPLFCSVPNMRDIENIPPVKKGSVWELKDPYTSGPGSYNNIEYRTVPECELSVGDTWEEEYVPSGKHLFHNHELNFKIADANQMPTDPGPHMLPIYCEETTWERPWAPNPLTTNSNQITTGNLIKENGLIHNMTTIQFNNNSPPLKKYVFKSPDIEQEDNNKMVFNYTIRIRTEITFEFFRDIKDIMQSHDGKNLVIDKRYLINLPTIPALKNADGTVHDGMVMCRNHGFMDPAQYAGGVQRNTAEPY